MTEKLKKNLLLWTGILAFYVGLQFFVDRKLPTGEPPALSGTTLDGKPFELAQLRGRPAVIYFWASWCGICGAMRSTMASIAGEHPLISVALQSGDAAEVARYEDEHGFHPATLVDEDGDIGKRYRLRGVPAVFVLGPDGTIRFATVGYSSEPGLRLRLWLAGHTGDISN